MPSEATAETVRWLQSRGHLAMIGDGSNDARALVATGLLNPPFAAVDMGASSLLVVVHSTLRPLD